MRTQFGDLGEDENLVNYFQAVLDKREELEDEDRSQQSLTAAIDASPTSGNGNGQAGVGIYAVGLIHLEKNK